MSNTTDWSLAAMTFATQKKRIFEKSWNLQCLGPEGGINFFMKSRFEFQTDQKPPAQILNVDQSVLQDDLHCTCRNAIQCEIRKQVLLTRRRITREKLSPKLVSRSKLRRQFHAKANPSTQNRFHSNHVSQNAVSTTVLVFETLPSVNAYIAATDFQFVRSRVATPSPLRIRRKRHAGKVTVNKTGYSSRANG